MLVAAQQEVTGLLELTVVSGVKSIVSSLADRNIFSIHHYSALAPYMYQNTGNQRNKFSLISGVLYRLDQVYSDTSVQSDLVSVELDDRVIKTKRVTSRVDSDLVKQLRRSDTLRVEVNIYTFNIKNRPVVAVYDLSSRRFFIHIAPTAEGYLTNRLHSLGVSYRNSSLLDGAFLSMVTGRVIPLRDKH